MAKTSPTGARSMSNIADKAPETVNAMAAAGLKWLENGGKHGKAMDDAMWAAGEAVAGDATGAMMVVAKALVGKAVSEGRWAL